MNIQDMSDLEYRVYQSRQFGARIYRAEGHEWFARRVEEGFEDDCNPVRLGRFFRNLPDSCLGLPAE
jgi:hypothetical protein